MRYSMSGGDGIQDPGQLQLVGMPTLDSLLTLPIGSEIVLTEVTEDNCIGVQNIRVDEAFLEHVREHKEHHPDHTYAFMVVLLPASFAPDTVPDDLTKAN